MLQNSATRQVEIFKSHRALQRYVLATAKLTFTTLTKNFQPRCDFGKTFHLAISLRLRPFCTTKVSNLSLRNDSTYVSYSNINRLPCRIVPCSNTPLPGRSIRSTNFPIGVNTITRTFSKLKK